MSDITNASLDKIKFLDQMLEDLAGDKLELSKSYMRAGVKRQDIAEDLDGTNTLH